MLTDSQWSQLAPLFVTEPSPHDPPPRGRPRASNRDCFEGILWILRSGARWQDLPDRFPSPSTCWRRLKEWEESGLLLRVWRVFLSLLDVEGLLSWEETFLDGSFAPAKKGEQGSVRRSEERERRGWFWSMARVYLWEYSWKLPPLRK